MRLTALVLALCSCGLASAGQPTERFRSADHFTFCTGSTEARYGNADGNVRITMQVLFLGQQVFDSPSNSPETRFDKSAGSLDFTMRLSDFDPNLPPDVVHLIGTDLGNDQLRHDVNDVLPGPYHIAGTYNGVQVDITMTNVHVTGSLFSQGSNAVTPPMVNPVLNEICDVQFDDPVGSNNSIVAIPAQVSGWIVSPLFTVQSMRVDVTGIQQAGQVPAHIVAPTGFQVLLGLTEGGNLSSLGAVDGDVLRVRKFVVPNQLVPPIRVELTASVPSTPTYLSFLTSSRSATPGSLEQILDLFDYSQNAYSAVDRRNDPMATTFEFRKLDATASVSNYIGPNGALKARYQVRQTGPTAVIFWSVEHDFAGWVVTP